jgi:HK97 family phage portal protein
MNFDRTFSMSDVLYFRLGYQDIRNLLSRLMKGYNQLLSLAVGKYRRSGGRKGIARVDTTAKGDADYQKKVDDLFTNQFKAYFESENAVVHLPKGVDYSEQKGETDRKSTSDVVDIVTITREAFERTAQALKIPPALLRGDIADIEKSTDNFLTFCIDPLLDMIAEEINRKRFGRTAYLAGNYISIDTTCIKHVDIFAVAANVDKLIACGMYDIDELRRKLRDSQLNTAWSKKHWITKNYQAIEQLKGGEVV